MTLYYISTKRIKSLEIASICYHQREQPNSTKLLMTSIFSSVIRRLALSKICEEPKFPALLTIFTSLTQLNHWTTLLYQYHSVDKMLEETLPPAQNTSPPAANPNNWIADLKTEISTVLIGQEDLVDRLIICLLCNGHILLEGMPGVAKTLAVKSLSGALNIDFSRLQFTPDLLPADLIGTMIYNPGEQTFTPKLGPIFSNLVLADEINRAPAKVQSALLEAMQERQVTIGDNSYPLPAPFLVLATQNPVDQEGTYRLPEAQLDRFLLKVLVDYPTPEEELHVLRSMATTSPKIETNPAVSIDQVNASREVVNSLYIDPTIEQYIIDLVQATRKPGEIDQALGPLIRAGASPRASISLALAAKASAYTKGRDHVIPQDVKDLAPDVLRHRLLLSYEAEAEQKSADDIILTLLNKVPVP